MSDTTEAYTYKLLTLDSSVGFPHRYAVESASEVCDGNMLIAYIKVLQ